MPSGKFAVTYFGRGGDKNFKVEIMIIFRSLDRGQIVQTVRMRLLVYISL